MKKRIILTSFVLVSLIFTFSSCASKELDRAGLVDLMEQYMDAVAKHDASGLPLSEKVKLVENTKVIPIGEGLWKNATGSFTNFKVFAADPISGQVGVIGIIEVNNDPTIIGARLKVEDSEITEIDHMIIPKYGDSLNVNFSAIRPGLITPVDPSERIAHDEMLRIANSYYEAIVNDNGDLCPFAEESQRRENGGVSAGARTPDEWYDDDFTTFRKMKCGEQLSTGVMSYITDINRRRFIAVDEEMGLVFAYSIFVHDGEPKVMKITGVPGVTERVNNYGPFDLPAAHIFKIKGGKVYEIEAIGYLTEHGIKNGWE